MDHTEVCTRGCAPATVRRESARPCVTRSPRLACRAPHIKLATCWCPSGAHQAGMGCSVPTVVLPLAVPPATPIRKGCLFCLKLGLLGGIPRGLLPPGTRAARSAGVCKGGVVPLAEEDGCCSWHCCCWNCWRCASKVLLAAAAGFMVTCGQDCASVCRLGVRAYEGLRAEPCFMQQDAQQRVLITAAAAALCCTHAAPRTASPACRAPPPPWRAGAPGAPPQRFRLAPSNCSTAVYGRQQQGRSASWRS